MWMWVGRCGFVPVVGLGCRFGMWVCLVWWMWVCADLFGCLFWWMWVCAGGGCWCCCGNGCCAVVVVVDNEDEDDRE